MYTPSTTTHTAHIGSRLPTGESRHPFFPCKAIASGANPGATPLTPDHQPEFQRIKLEKPEKRLTSQFEEDALQIPFWKPESNYFFRNCGFFLEEPMTCISQGAYPNTISIYKNY